MALNVTTAVFAENCNTATASPSLAQWDTEQVLQISGIDLPDSYKVEFSTVYTRNAIPKIGNAAGVDIPNELLQRSAPITAYVVLYGENGGRNREYWITIYITPGQPPETITPDPEQADVIDEAIAALNNGVERAEAAVEAAEGSAGDAEAAAEAVQNLSVAAETLATGEPATVEKTVDEETGAVTLTFGLPRGAKGDPLTYEDLTPEQKAELVQGPILEAQNAAVTAVGNARASAVDAVGSAGTTAVGAVSQAGTTQVGAVNQAGATQVQAVENKGDEVLASIPQDYTDLVDDVADLSRQISNETTGLDTKAPVILETVSGAIASFSDGADSMQIRKIVATIKPVQEGTGDPSPDNVRPISGWTGANIYQAGLPKGYTYANYITVNNAISIPTNIDFNAHDIGVICVHQPLVYKQYGTIYSAGYKGEAYNTTRLIFNVNIGDYLFNNATIARVPGNFVESESSFIKTVNRFGSIDVNNRTITGNTTVGSNTDVTAFTVGGANISVRYKYIIVKKTDASGGQRLLVLVACRNADGIAGLYDLVNGAFWTTASSSDISATGDAPSDLSVLYNVTLSVNWQSEAGTVYSGNVDVITGKLGKTIGPNQYFKSKLSAYSRKDENITGTGYTRYQFYPTVSGGVLVGTNERISEKLCSIAPYLYSDTSATPHWYHNVYGTINLFVPDGTDENTEAEFIIPLATTQETQLDPQEMTTLYGQNNIWADTGDVTVEYPADTKIYIDNKITQAIANALNS